MQGAGRCTPHVTPAVPASILTDRAQHPSSLGRAHFLPPGLGAHWAQPRPGVGSYLAARRPSLPVPEPMGEPLPQGFGARKPRKFRRSEQPSA